MPRSIFFSVGEPSGDQHAARLIREIHQLAPEIQCRGFGGADMRAAGCDIDVDLTQEAVVGLLEVLPKLRYFFKVAGQAEQAFEHQDIDAVVLVDFPGFNWHIAKRAKRFGIPVYYYCPPQLWAWGGWRIRKMRRLIDHVLAVLPIEKKYFGHHGISTTYVGHPFFDAVHQSPLDQTILNRCEHDLAAGSRLVAVLPGSRNHEVHQNWPIFLESIRRLHRSNPHVKFLVASYRESQMSFCRESLTLHDRDLPIEFFIGKTSEIIEGSECAMMVSGSVSLELMARRTPAVVTYRVGRFLHAVAKRLVNLESFTLPNLMGDKKVFPETISVGNPQPAIEMIVSAVDRFLNDEAHLDSVRQELDILAEQYATPGASRRAANCLIGELEGDNR